ncbi:MAG: hypothetical protein L7F78_25965, partial [Syntrophales bacterium LBB04]|nr:hypothetical protein [Syntrophales bacterium LBB04]
EFLRWGTGALAPVGCIFFGGAIQESPIFIKTYDFTKWLLEHTIRFPKSQRFVMAKRIEEAALQLVQSCCSWFNHAD